MRVATRPTGKPPLQLGSTDPVLKPSPTVLLLVDFINPLDFEGADQLARSALRAARNAAALKQRLRSTQVIYANDNYGTWRSSFHDVLAYCQSLGGMPSDMARCLEPKPRDITVLKPRHSAFFATPVELLLEQLQAQRIVLAGLATDLCVLFTAMDVYLRGYKLWVPSDCVAAESTQRHRAALDYMRYALKADIRAAVRQRPG